MTVDEQIGKKIMNLRKEKGLTQTEFGNMFNISQNAVTKIENGKRVVTYDELLRFADYFEVSTDYLIKENSVKGDNPELQYICDYMGLSEEAINNIVNVKDYLLIPADFEFRHYFSFQYDGIKAMFDNSKNVINDFLSSDYFFKLVSRLSMLKALNSAISNINTVMNSYNSFSEVKKRNELFSDHLFEAGTETVKENIKQTAINIGLTIDNLEKEQRYNRYSIYDIMGDFVQKYTENNYTEVKGVEVLDFFNVQESAAPVQDEFIESGENNG